MITFKQLESLYWVVKLGGFSQAAHKLNTTQSAVSKRVQELEALLGTPLFDRNLRTARISDKGQEVFAQAQKLLNQRDELVQLALEPASPKTRIRIGVTEVTAMTWLPRFVRLITQKHPGVIIDPDVDSGAMLRDKLLARELDLMIAADTFRDAHFVSKRIGRLRLEWVCKSGLLQHGGKTLHVHDLLEHRILIQGPQSGTGLLFLDWFKSQGLLHSEMVVSNSLVALIGLTVAGFGVSHLPPATVSPMMKAGLLEALKVKPALPEANYAAIVRTDARSSLTTSIANLAQECCDFTRLHQT